MNKAYSGLADGGKSYFILEKLQEKFPVVVVVNEDDMAAAKDNFTAVSQLFSNPAKQSVPSIYTFLKSDIFERLNTLNSIIADPYAVIITTIDSLCTKTISKEEFRKRLLEIIPGRDYNFNHLIDLIVNDGYNRVQFVEEKGQFSRRGEILDIWPSDQTLPWRLVFNINTLESLNFFDVSSQRSGQLIKKAALVPAKETNQSYLSGFLPPNALIYFDFPKDQQHALPEEFNNYEYLINDALAPDAIDAGFNSFTRWGGNFPLFISELNEFINQDYRIIIFCSNQGERERIEDILHDNKININRIELFIGPLVNGFYSAKRKLAVFSSQEVLYKKKLLSFPKFKTGRRLEGLWEISSGDYVVHERYGIGRYQGLKKIVRGEQQAEYIYLEYKGGDKLYVPVEDFHVVQKYVGIEGCRPKLHSLDTAVWERVRHKAEASAQELAEELLKLYAQRQNTPGYSFSDDNHWEKELSDSFPYQETEDQLKAIEAVKNDLQLAKPMERIVCGDVGFGKTEVAVRAAFKVVQDSKQVAILVPTTVLAEQHGQTFTNRLAPFPVHIAVLSRFQSKHEQKKIIENLRSGAVDIVIGTHRLIQKDIVFKDLGLLIIDEEHRFGVKQKEKIKTLKKNVDVLLLSATPIPRTLSLALSNLRDLSVIETPPYGRLPIETHLSIYDENTVKKIIEAELSRGGQVFYVYNRVETILSKADHLKKLIPDIRWGVIHGQMSALEIEKNMWKFLHRQLDVLIATTIIESGLDIPTVNTMIIEEAENFGLAQLYQLRGRIGREKQKAYCYLFYNKSDLTIESRKRLEALQEFGELGSGFRLALRDLEIRGAGNILSAKQHGFVKEIGFELYSRLLDDANRKMKGLAPKHEEEWKTEIDFLLPAFLPDGYISSEDLRILFYRRLSGSKFDDELSNLKEELKDRFGVLPQPAENLFILTNLRLLAEKFKVKSIVESESALSFYFSDKMEFSSDEKAADFMNHYKDIIEFIHDKYGGIKIKKALLKQPLLEFAADFLKNMKKYFKVKPSNSKS